MWVYQSVSKLVCAHVGCRTLEKPEMAVHWIEQVGPAQLCVTRPCAQAHTALHNTGSWGLDTAPA